MYVVIMLNYYNYDYYLLRLDFLFLLLWEEESSYVFIYFKLFFLLNLKNDLNLCIKNVFL